MDTRALLLIAVIALTTALVRFLPFLVFSAGRTPAFVTYLGKVLQAAAIGMLVVYCFKHVSLGSALGFLPDLLAGGAVVASYLWKRSAVLSITLGTLCYMLLLRVMV